eukprot:TRINITY_DN3842_c1_g1_i2.p1 TRINITY_DN3842_c1_g1~~TRINITY_DN3842_c1_g1_i2.p1  ORF type:complete len:598 (+),score=60.24 TRINITY_DN3842_c1_g1_i2:77-1870(+)
MGCCQGAEKEPLGKHKTGENEMPGQQQRRPTVAMESPPANGHNGTGGESSKEGFLTSDFRKALEDNFPRFWNQYNVGEEIGSGLGSVTFLCEPKDESLRTSRLLCCKVVKAASGSEDTKQHWKEIVSYKALSPDDRITEMIDHFMNENWAVVVLKVMEGGPISVGEQRWPEPMVASVAKQILLLLEDLHTAGYCHLDIKPAHILTTEVVSTTDPTLPVKIRVCGFSCCTRFKPGTATLAEIPESPLFIAPEIWKIVMGVPSGTLYDERCDIWSLGVVCYLMLSGRHPFTNKCVKDCQESDYVDLYEAIYAKDESVIEFPEEYFGGISNEARHFLLDVLQIDFKSRSTAAQALNHPFIRKFNPDLTYLEGTRPGRVLFHFEPLRKDISVSRLGSYMKPRGSLNASSTQGSPSPFLTAGDDCPSPSGDAAFLEPQTSSRRRKMSWTEETPMTFVRNDSGGKLGQLHMEATPTQSSINGGDSGNRLKSPKLFMGSPVKAPLHVNPNSPHLQPPPFFPKERRFEEGGEEDEDNDSSSGSAVLPEEGFSIGEPAKAPNGTPRPSPEEREKAKRELTSSDEEDDLSKISETHQRQEQGESSQP